MAVANSVTVLMDAAVIVLALLLTRPWGLRVPAWLLALPVWVATGLLAPIMAGFPVQLAVDALGGPANTTAADGEPFLDVWVFGVVYTGFIVQGLTLGALLRAVRPRPLGPTVARAGSGSFRSASPGGPACPPSRRPGCALPPLTAHLLWACGGTAGLDETRLDRPDQ